MAVSFSEIDTDIKMEMDDNGLDIVLQRIIDDIKLLQLGLTATHSYVEVLKKQLYEAMELEQELDKQLNTQLDNEVSIRNTIELNIKTFHTQKQLSPVVSSQDQQISNPHECLSDIADAKELLKKLEVQRSANTCSKHLHKSEVCETSITSCFSCGRTDVSEWSKYYCYDNGQICLDCEKLILDPTILDSSEYTEYSQPSHAKKCFTCLNCKKEFTLVRNIIAHLRFHTGYRPHICYRCGMTFTLANALSSHLLSHDQVKPSVTFKCDVCSKQLINDYQFKMHLLTHSTENAFVCAVCGVAYPWESKLQIHMRNHTGVRPYACSMCPKTFIMKCHLKKHTDNNHSEKKPVQCPNCLRIFNSNDTLRRHHREMHLGVPSKH